MFRLARLDGGNGLEIDRLNFLTDGIYAIVMTLLVLELKIPEGLTPDRVLPALIENGPKFAAFAISFSAAAVGWSYAYLAHSVMRRSNFIHLIMTLASLMAASLIPFAAAVMGSYPDSPWGYEPYCVVIAALCATLTIDMFVNRRALVDPRIDPRVPTAFWLSTMTVGLIAISGMPLAFWSPHAMFWIIVVVSMLIWVDYYLLSAWIGRETARIEELSDL
ncbi:TMEM175 family protein [Sphingomonas sp.]|uniref:TMEM175 family protein n=1 Tax=Sphingomonas sp. TaxID=28214 RepID=UPI0025D9C7F0|nr:TMEM175 family protein [Sphingomonas sp.]